MKYLPYFMSRKSERERVSIEIRSVDVSPQKTSKRWTENSDLVRQAEGKDTLQLERSSEYGMHIVHAMESDAVYSMNLNVMNDHLIDNLPTESCVEVTYVADRTGVHPYHVGNLPVQLAALSRGISDVQTLASDAILEKDLTKAYMACALDPCTAASAGHPEIRDRFNELIDAERPWLEEYWGPTLRI